MTEAFKDIGSLRQACVVARVWTILGTIAFVAFVVGSLLGGLSLLLYGFGATRGQLAVAGLAETIVSFVFLIAGTT